MAGPRSGKEVTNHLYPLSLIEENDRHTAIHPHSVREFWVRITKKYLPAAVVTEAASLISDMPQVVPGLAALVREYAVPDLYVFSCHATFSVIYQLRQP